MRKTDIATLVQTERHRQFARFRERELAAVDAVNTGKHGKLQAPLEKPTDEKLFEAFTGGESVNYWGQFFSKRLTLDESAGLLMALDPSQVKFAAHVIGGNIPPEKGPPFGIANDLVRAFTDMRGDIVDWRKTSDDKYRAGDLIAWAKEKGFVADEVLAAWEAYIKAEAVKAEQETGNESATTESGQSEQEKVPHAATGMTTREIGAVFDGLPFKAENWPKRASQARWLSDAKLSLGAKGGASSMWCPFAVAKASFNQASERDRPKRLRDLNNRFKINHALGPWRDVWDEFYSMFNDAD